MNSAKIAPELLLAFQDYREDRQTDLYQYNMRLDIPGDVDSLESPRVNVFLHCDEAAELDHLEEMGVKLNIRKGRIRTASLSLEKLDRLFEAPDITYVGVSHLLHPLMDVASDRVQLPEFRDKTGLTGEGVIIGIVDTGIDATHPAFKERILRIWDQTLPPIPGQERPYGLELTGEELTTSPDPRGHGTHVAGIAAGSNTILGGVASGSELVIVKSDREMTPVENDILMGSLESVSVADGIGYIFEVADSLSMPAVVNLSIGAHFDPHDGTDSLSELIDDLSGEGRIVCCAAGNEGNDNIHARRYISQDSTPHVISFSVPETSGYPRIPVVYLNGWYSGEDRIAVAVQSPSGELTNYQDIIQDQDPILSYNLPDARIRIATHPSNPINKDHQFFIELGPPPYSNQQVTPGTWQLLLLGSNIKVGQVDVWVLDGKNQPQVTFTDGGISDALKVGSPGAARRAITVASYTTKVEWQNIDGNRVQMPLTLDDISDFSSEGPLRNGYQKPDVAAPGAFIASCRSDTATLPRRRQIDSHYTVMAGTSMSAPFISGIVALLLQHDPTLTPEQIKALLQASSSIPGHSVGSFHPQWGYGLINADALADVLASLRS